MRFSASFARKIYVFAFFAIFVSAVAVWHFSPRVESAVPPETPVETANFDIRADQSAESRETIKKFLADAGKTDSFVSEERKRILKAEKNLSSGAAKLKIELGGGLRIPETIAPDLSLNEDFLTAPSNEKRASILKNFLRQNSELFGLDASQIAALETTADYTNPDGVLSFVHFEQTIKGVPVFQGEVKAAFTRRNEIVRIINNLAPNLDYENLSTDFGSAESAVQASAKFTGGDAASGQATAEKIYFPIETGVALPAWRVLLGTEKESLLVIVDARSGTLLWRKNLTESQTQAATYGVYGNTTSFAKTADSASPFTPGCLSPIGCAQPPAVARQSFTLIGNEPPYAFNNLGWIPDGENRTIGNAAEAGIDRIAPNGIDDNGWAFGNPNRNFVYVYNPAPGIPSPGEEPLPTTQTYPPSAFQQGAITNAFYAVNRWHDETYRLGFTEAARNFQTDNFGRGGSGSDSISVEIQDGSGTNGANFSTTPDGTRGRLQMFIWTGPTPDRDGALDNQVIFHEATHGLSNRLHGNATGLSGNMARGMGEGWSDFYALAMLSEPTDAALGTYTVGGYITYQILPGFEANYYYGIRRFPTAIMASVGPNGRPHNPLTFRYVNSDCNTLIGTTTTNPNSAFPRGPIGVTTCDQIHNLGELWNVTLWEVRNQLIERHGASEGNRRVLQYVTDGMKLSPFNPTMLQARDAIIAAAFASDPNDVLPIRRGFAIRGMGFNASIQNVGSGSNNTQVTESFDATGNVRIGAGFAAADPVPGGNNDGYFVPGERITLTIPLMNDTGAPITGVTLQIAGGASASYGNIANGQTVTQTLNYTIPFNTPCPGNFVITFNINSSAGAKSEARSIHLGIPSAQPATFTNSTPLTIPNSGTSTPYGTSVNVSGLSGNRKIKLEITGFSHTFPGDVDVLLVSPAGQKFIVMSDAVNVSSTQTNANVVLRDDAATSLPSTAVNMNGDWKPTNFDTADTFPSPAPAAPYGSPAPAGTTTFASAFGTSGAAMNGTWTLYVVDDTPGDGGSIAGWKLTFETADYFCPICLTTCPRLRTRADFDGDGRTDISVFRPSNGVWYLNQSTTGFGALNWGLGTDRLAPGDYDGDAKTDFAVFRPNADASQPDFYVLNSSNFTYSGYSWGLPGDVPVIEDYDGDGRSDAAVFRPSNHIFYVLRSASGSLLSYSNISSGTPVAGNFDGDNKGDFATYSINGWYLSQSSGNYATVNFTRWGADGDQPVPADYDGDGKDDFAVFRPSDRTWYIRGSSGANSYIQWGLADDRLVPGDYDGDGKADAAVYRGGTWYVNRSTVGILITQFGLGGDVPVPTGYLP